MTISTLERTLTGPERPDTKEARRARIIRARIDDFNKLEQDYSAALGTDDAILVSWRGKHVIEFETIEQFIAWSEADGE